MLGNTLFRNRCQSDDGRLSCSSCHDPTTNDADDRAFDVGDNGTTLPRQHQHRVQRHDLGPADLEGYRATLAGSRALLFAPAIKDVSPATVRLLARDLAPDRRGREVYGRSPDTWNVIDVPRHFGAVLVTVDLHLRGDKTALIPREQAYPGVFKASGYAACDQGVDVGGGPMQRHGIFRAMMDSDRMGLPVPSLRKVATLPCFRDGRAAPLATAVSDIGRPQSDLEPSVHRTVAISALRRALASRCKNIPIKETQ